MKKKEKKQEKETLYVIKSPLKKQIRKQNVNTNNRCLGDNDYTVNTWKEKGRRKQAYFCVSNNWSIENKSSKCSCISNLLIAVLRRARRDTTSLWRAEVGYRENLKVIFARSKLHKILSARTFVDHQRERISVIINVAFL